MKKHEIASRSLKKSKKLDSAMAELPKKIDSMKSALNVSELKPADMSIVIRCLLDDYGLKVINKKV